MASTPLPSLLRELTALPGPPGHESQVALAFAKHLHSLTGREVKELGSPVRL